MVGVYNAFGVIGHQKTLAELVWIHNMIEKHNKII